jgi:hypothetical protein
MSMPFWHPSRTSSNNETLGNIHPTTPHHTAEQKINQLKCCENLKTNVPSLGKKVFLLLLLLLLG